MPNYNYLKGVRKERLLVNKAKIEGKIAFRSAGSHSPIDVCIIDFRNFTIDLVQCKPQGFKVEKLESEFQMLNNNFKVSFKVI